MKRQPAGQPNGGQYAPSAVPAPTAAPVVKPASSVTDPEPDLSSILFGIPGVSVMDANKKPQNPLLQDERHYDGDPDCAMEPDQVSQYWGGERCTRCQSRYCKKGCFAGKAGYVYITNGGWRDYTEAGQWVAHNQVDSLAHTKARRVELKCGLGPAGGESLTQKDALFALGEGKKLVVVDTSCNQCHPVSRA